MAIVGRTVPVVGASSEVTMPVVAIWSFSIDVAITTVGVGVVVSLATMGVAVWAVLTMATSGSLTVVSLVVMVFDLGVKHIITIAISSLQVLEVLVATIVKVQELKACNATAVVVVSKVVVLEGEVCIPVVVAEVDSDGGSDEESSREFHLFLFSI